MKYDVLNIRNILDIVFKITKKNASILADVYLIKDSSIISKWKNNKTKPKNEDILKVVDFTIDESTATQRKMIRNEIEILVYNSLLSEEIKNSLLHIEDFKEFLWEVLYVSTSSWSNNDSQVKIGADFISTNVGKNESDETYDHVNRGGDEYRRESETITAFSDDIEGKYSGVVEFNMVLSKDRGANSRGKSGGHAININSNGSFSLGSKLDKLQKKLKPKNVLGTIVTGAFLIFLLAQGSNGSHMPQKDSSMQDIRVYAAPQASAATVPLPDEEPLTPVHDKNTGDSQSAISGKENYLPVQVKADEYTDDHETQTEAEDDLKVDRNNNSDKYVEISSTKNSDKSNTINKTKNNPARTAANNATNTTNTNNITNNANNYTNCSNATIIIEGVNIEGDNNILGHGSNISINVQK